MIVKSLYRTYNKDVTISYDPAKSAWNIKTRGIPFDLTADFDFNTALVAIDTRHDYGEVRYVAIGFINSRLHVLVFKETTTGIRVISLRKANAREARYYERHAK